MHARKAASGTENLKISHQKYALMTPDQKALTLQRRFGGTCALEASFARSLREVGFTKLDMNVWQSVPIKGSKVPREADIKVAVGGGRKIVVLCDGEAFHGPKAIFGNPEDRINEDRETALAFFRLGYSVIRYSETEIHSGFALNSFQDLFLKLGKWKKIYRNWCPKEILQKQE